MHLRSPVSAISALCLGLSVTSATVIAAEPVTPPAAPAAEPMDVGGKKIPVLLKKEVKLSARADEAVKSRILWYRAFDGKAWGAWQKHGIQFDRQTDVLWAAPEGHWQAHVQIEQTSGAKSDEPKGDLADAKSFVEFIMDRSAPTVRITFPTANEKLRGNDRYTIRWEATDAHLRNAPIAIRFSRDGSVWENVADNLTNSGSYEWTTPGGHVLAGQLKIEAMDKSGNVGQTVTSGIMVDSVKPTGKVTGPAIVNARAINFTCEVEDRGPAGVASARLWFSQDDGTSWTEGPFLQAPYRGVAWTAPADGRFRLAIVATDGAGNITAAPRGKAEDQYVTVVDTVAPTIALASTIGINEANNPDQTARRAFKPGDRLQVAFTIRDANLKPNSVAVAIQLDPAKPFVDLGTGLPTDTAFRFELGKDVKVADTKTARIKVMATDLAGNPGEIIATEAFEIQTTVSAGTVGLE